MVVCDVGCGKGGDLNKWMMHRPKKWIGIDGSADCIDQARQRHSQCVSRGRGNMQTEFFTLDLCDPDLTYPVATCSVDIVTSLFFLQFTAESQEAIAHAVNEVFRMIKPGGVFVALGPDGDRIWDLLKCDNKVRYGHFTLTRCREDWSPSDSIFGLEYRFSLAGEGCSEHVLLPAYVERLLADRGFEALEGQARMTFSAQQFFASAPDRNQLLEQMMKNEHISYHDWWSLGLFRILAARLPQ